MRFAPWESRVIVICSNREKDVLWFLDCGFVRVLAIKEGHVGNFIEE